MKNNRGLSGVAMVALFVGAYGCEADGTVSEAGGGAAATNTGAFGGSGGDGLGGSGGAAVGGGGDAGGDVGGCGDVSSDPDNCGSCGHSCLGSECLNGFCRPEVLGSHEVHPRLLALDDADVYWASEGTGGLTPDGLVGRVSKPGGVATVLASDQQGPLHILVDDTRVVWSTMNASPGIWAAPKVGGVAQVLVGGEQNPDEISGFLQGIAVDDTAVYFGDDFVNGAGAVKRMANGWIEELATTEYIHAIALSHPWVYWVESGTEAAYCHQQTDGSVRRVPTVGGSAEVLADNVRCPSAIAVDETHVYWLSWAAGRLMRVAISGGGAELLYSPPLPVELALDETSVYVTAADSQVHKVPKTGGTPTVLAASQKRPIGVAVDDTHVYWVNLYGSDSLNRVAK